MVQVTHGGLLIVYSTILNGNGTFTSSGSKAAVPAGAHYRGWSGGSSGGGSINVFYKDSSTFEGTYNVNGGTATLATSGQWSNGYAYQGGTRWKRKLCLR